MFREHLPSDWNLVRLGALAHAQYGLSRAASGDGAVPILGMEQMASGSVVKPPSRRVDLSDREREVYLLAPGDFLFNRTNSLQQVGKSAVVPDWLGECTFASYIVRLRLDTSRILPSYLACVLNSPTGWAHLRRLATPGVSQYNINLTALRRNYHVPLPPLREQERIVGVIGKWDMRVLATNRLITAKRQLRRGLMQQLLTAKKRFRGYEETEPRYLTLFGELPRSWSYPKMADIANEVSERAGLGFHGYPVLSCSKHDGLVESVKYFGKKVFSDDRTNYKMVRRNQFAYPSNHIEEGSIGLLTSHDVGVVSPIYTVFQLCDDVLPDYLYLIFKTDRARHLFASNTNGSIDRRGSLRWKQFKSLHVPLPPRPEQEDIVSLFHVLDRELKTLERLRDALDLQRRGVMELLLSGKVRMSA